MFLCRTVDFIFFFFVFREKESPILSHSREARSFKIILIGILRPAAPFGYLNRPRSSIERERLNCVPIDH